jgi:hypothetical protein
MVSISYMCNLHLSAFSVNTKKWKYKKIKISLATFEKILENKEQMEFSLQKNIGECGRSD